MMQALFVDAVRVIQLSSEYKHVGPSITASIRSIVVNSVS
jgi:hypothetical protein